MSLHFEKHYGKIQKQNKNGENRKYFMLLLSLLAENKCKQYLTEEIGQRDIRRIQEHAIIYLKINFIPHPHCVYVLRWYRAIKWLKINRIMPGKKDKHS